MLSAKEGQQQALLQLGKRLDRIEEVRSCVQACLLSGDSSALPLAAVHADTGLESRKARAGDDCNTGQAGATGC